MQRRELGKKVRVKPTREQRVQLDQALGANKSLYNAAIYENELAYQSYRVYEITLGYLAGWGTGDPKQRPRTMWELRRWCNVWGVGFQYYWMSDKTATKEQQRCGVVLSYKDEHLVRILSARMNGLNDKGQLKVDILEAWLTAQKDLRSKIADTVTAMRHTYVDWYADGLNPFDFMCDSARGKALKANLNYQAIRDSKDARVSIPYMGYLPGTAARDTVAAQTKALKNAMKGNGGFPQYKKRGQSRLSMSMQPGGSQKVANIGTGDVDWGKFGQEAEYAEVPIPFGTKAAEAKILEETGDKYLYNNGPGIAVRPFTVVGRPTKKPGTNVYAEGVHTPIVWRDSVRIPFARNYKGDPWIPCARSGYLPQTRQGHHVKYIGACVSREGTKYYISLTVSMDVADPEPRNGRTCGIDFALKNNLVVASSTESDGAPVLDPAKYQAALQRLQYLERRLALVQRRAARRKGPAVLDNSGRPTKMRQQPSASWVKTNREAAELQRTIGNILGDLRHQATAKLIANGASHYNHEDLDLEHLLDKTPNESRKDKRLRKTFRRIGAGEMCRQLAYKAKWAGATSKGRFSAYSSKQCPSKLGGCSQINHQHTSQTLFRCPTCGFGVDFGTEILDSGLAKNHRDVVASANIRSDQKDEDLRMAEFAKRQSTTVLRTRDCNTGPNKPANRKRAKLAKTGA